MFARNTKYEYSNCHMMLIKPSNGKNFKNGCIYIKGGVGFEQRDAHVEADSLQEGVYFFYVEMDWVIQESYNDFEFSATSYGPAECIFEEVTQDFPQHVVLKRAIVAESELGGENIMQVAMEHKNAPSIVKLTTKKATESGYLWTLVKNGEKDKRYKQVVNYTKFEGLTLLKPFEGNKYELSCEAGQANCVIIKCNTNGYAFQEEISEQVIVPDEHLINLCIINGKPSERAPGIV